MKRREFITLLGGAASWPLAAGAQRAKVHQIGALLLGNADADSFRAGNAWCANPAMSKGLTFVLVSDRWKEGSICFLTIPESFLLRADKVIE
jgi:hypothetical protein